MRLRTKFAIALLAITLVLSGATYAGMEFYKAQAVGEVEQNVNETATVVAGQIDRRLRERRDFVGYVASRPRAARFNESGAYLDAFLTNSRFFAAQIIAANGTVVSFRGGIAEERRRAVIGSDRSDAPYFERGLQGAYIGEPEFARRPNRPDTYVLTFSAPIFGADREVKGVFAAAIFLNQETVFGMVPAAETSSQQVTIGSGDSILYRSDRTFNQTVRKSATVETTGWTVEVARDRSGLNRRLEQLALFQGVGLLVVLCSMVGFGYWQYSVSLRQTERLLDGFDRIREGQYDYEVSLRGGTEWERIGDGVNELSDGLRRREAALRERKQRLEVLHRVLRHNVRNRMSIILNYAGIIGDTVEDDLVVEAAETIESAGEDLNSLSEKARQLESVLDDAESGPEPVDVARIVREVVDEMREAYPGVGIDVSAPGEAWALTLPAFRLAVENAVENACEHNDSDDPRVEVTVAERDVGPDAAGAVEAEGTADATGAAGADGGVRIEVADNGPGIPEQDRTVIEEGRETDLEHGSGLGLWVLYWIVDNSGGELTFDGNDPSGAVVRIDLRAASRPAGTDDEAEAGRATDAAPASGPPED
ncbi:MAG: cache domain-containing protein [Haloferacaceae archaeon]